MSSVNGLEKIKLQIKKEAEEKAKSIMNKAKEEANRIKEEYRKSLELRRKEILDRAKRTAELEKNRIDSSTNLKIHNMKLEMKERLIEEVLEDVKRKLSELRRTDEKRYYNAIKTLATDALKELGQTKDIEFILSPEDSKIGKKLCSEFNATLGESEPIIGGIIVRTRDGKFQVDNSFDSRIERTSDFLRSEVARVLFGE